MSEAGGDDVALRVLHTADWHLGKDFRAFAEADRTKLRRARLEAVKAILSLAEHEAVDAVLCAGDLFDDKAPEADWWRGLAELFVQRAWRDRPVVLLPGNHDPLTEGSVYAPSHPFRAALPGWVHVVDRDDFALPLGDEAVVLARPCRRQSGQDDSALALPSREPGDERIRIGLVHGSTFDQPGAQNNFPIARDAAVQRGLDYLAIGDTHGWHPYGPEAAPTVYPGTPEQTTFGERDTGNVALVLFRRRRPPRIRQVRVAQWTWREAVVTELGELQALREQDLARTVLLLRLELRVTPEEMEVVEAVLRELQGTDAMHGRAGVLQLDRSGLILETRDIEAVFAELPAVLQAAARALREVEAERPEVAQRALYHLYKLSREATST
jgi:DNA repair exonuclease SbcCD nuclease subunit